MNLIVKKYLHLDCFINKSNIIDDNMANLIELLSKNINNVSLKKDKLYVNNSNFDLRLANQMILFGVKHSISQCKLY